MDIIICARENGGHIEGECNGRTGEQGGGI